MSFLSRTMKETLKGEVVAANATWHRVCLKGECWAAEGHLNKAIAETAACVFSRAWPPGVLQTGDA